MDPLIVECRERLAKAHEKAAIDLLTSSPVLANAELDDPSVAADSARTKRCTRSHPLGTPPRQGNTRARLHGGPQLHQSSLTSRLAEIVHAITASLRVSLTGRVAWTVETRV